MRNYLIADMIDRSLDIRKCQDVIHASIDAMVTESPLIGDCSLLPYQKRTIQSAIGKLTNHYETQAELTNDPVFRTSCEEMIPRMQLLLNELTYRWHEIADEDKSAIARLNGLDSFPDWAAPLKVKYLDHEKASQEAADLAVERMVDKVEGEKNSGAAPR